MTAIQEISLLLATSIIFWSKIHIFLIYVLKDPLHSCDNFHTEIMVMTVNWHEKVRESNKMQFWTILYRNIEKLYSKMYFCFSDWKWYGTGGPNRFNSQTEISYFPRRFFCDSKNLHSQKISNLISTNQIIRDVDGFYSNEDHKFMHNVGQYICERLPVKLG